MERVIVNDRVELCRSKSRCLRLMCFTRTCCHTRVYDAEAVKVPSQKEICLFERRVWHLIGGMKVPE